MTLDEAAEFIRANHRGILSTVRADGRPQMSPIVAAVDDAGNVIISTRAPSFKVKNLRRNPQASVCIFADRFFGPWIQVDGTATIIDLPEAMDLLIIAYAQIAGQHDNWDEFRAAMNAEERVIVSIAPERVGPHKAG